MAGIFTHARAVGSTGRRRAEVLTSNERLVAKSADKCRNPSDLGVI